MSKLSNQTAAAKNAKAYFRQSEREEGTAKAIRKKEVAADAAKTAKLRTLRLEKEAADRLAAETSGQPARSGRRKTAGGKRMKVRMVY
jgi:hypothetical protein